LGSAWKQEAMVEGGVNTLDKMYQEHLEE